MKGWGSRGEGYVVVQALLFALVASGPWQATWALVPAALRPLELVLGAALLLGGGALALAGVLSLGRNLTPLPRPKAGATLVETGVYRLVRHPIYGGLAFVALGWALLHGSLLTALYALALLAFFDLKARREEVWLRERFPAYAAYARRVRKLVPFVY